MIISVSGTSNKESGIEQLDLYESSVASDVLKCMNEGYCNTTLKLVKW